MYVVPSASAPSVTALHTPEPVPVAAPAPATVVPVPVGSTGNVSVQVSVDTAAAAAPHKQRDLLSHLTSGDRKVIAAATGVQLTASDVVTEARASGAPPWNLIMSIALDRKSGALQGDITPGYLSAVFAAHANAPLPFNPQYLNAALLYLRSQAPSAPAPEPAPALAGPAGLAGTLNVFG